MNLRRLALIAGVGMLLSSGGRAMAQTPPVDSVVAAAQRVLAECDSQIVEMTFVTLVHEREVRDDGTIKHEKSFKSRIFVRDKEAHAYLEAMWEDGEPVTASRLADEQKKREKARRKRLEELRGSTEDGHGEGSRALSMLQPFLPGHSGNYEFPEVAADTVNGIPCWRVVVNPRSDEGRLVRGHLWVEQESYRAVAEEYVIPDLPGPPGESTVLLEHVPLLDDCAVPRHMLVRGKGKAFFFISFNFELEMFLDSVQVNPGLADSLFAVPDEN